MSFWDFENLRGIVGGSWVARPAADTSGCGLSTDTRSLSRGQVFLAIKGERFDGHAMLGRAQEAGASLAIIDDLAACGGGGALPPGLGVVRVPETGRALLALAAAYRATLSRTSVIAVCGSNGKTTTVRLIDAALSSSLSGTCSPKSFNNHIGVPLTILSARASDAYLICEVGTNAKGEIAQLAKVVRPDIAVITSIGREHLEKLGSVREVAREEASVLEFVRSSGESRAPGGGAGIVNADAPHLLETIARLERAPGVMIRFGWGEGADVRVVGTAAATIGGGQAGGAMRITLNDRSGFVVPLVGEHNASNAAAAIAVARRLGLRDDQIAAGLLRAKGPEMRLEVSEVRGVRVVNDAYNANPDSVRAALAAFPALARGASRRVLVLGDMLELGSHSEAEHRALGEELARMPDLGAVVLVGAAMGRAGEAMRSGGSGAEVRTLGSLDGSGAMEVASMLRAGDAVLLKGSRGMRLERVVSALSGGASTSGAVH